MPVSVNLETVHPRKLAAVRCEVAPGAVASAWGPALGKVWEFIRSQPGLWTDGHNVFLYHHPARMSNYDFSVFRNFRIMETARIEFRTEFYNLTNTPHFNNPSGNIGSTVFGRITSAKDPRLIQLTLRYFF